MVWMAPAPTGVVMRHSAGVYVYFGEEPSMFEFDTIGVDLDKNVIQIHSVDADGKTLLRRQLRLN